MRLEYETQPQLHGVEHPDVRLPHVESGPGRAVRHELEERVLAGQRLLPQPQLDLLLHPPRSCVVDTPALPSTPETLLYPLSAPPGYDDTLGSWVETQGGVGLGRGRRIPESATMVRELVWARGWG